jgi:hypothetical protein
MYVKVPIEEGDSSILSHYLRILENYQSNEMSIDFLCYWSPDPERDDCLSLWIAKNHKKYKSVNITYYTHSQLIQAESFVDKTDHHYEPNLETMTLEKVAHKIRNLPN